MRTILLAKIRWDKYSTSILTPLFSQLILLMMAYCRYDVKSFGEMLSHCLAPLPSLNFSLSFWSRRTEAALLQTFRRMFKYASSTLWFLSPSKSGSNSVLLKAFS